MTRTEAAFLTAPLVVPALLVPYFSAGSTFDMIATLAIFGTMLSYLGVLALGIPVYRIFRSRGWVSLWHAIGAGIVSGCLMWLAFWLLFSLSLGLGLGLSFEMLVSDESKVVLYGLPGGVAGAVCGLVFWLIARPDRAVV